MRRGQPQRTALARRRSPKLGRRTPRPAARSLLLLCLQNERRFEGFVERLSACLRTSVDRARAIVEDIDREAGWIDRGITGHRVKVLDDLRLSSGAHVVLCRVVAGAEYPPHVHVDAELAFCLQGHADLGDGPRLRPGDYWVVPAGTQHGCRNVGEQDCILLLCRNAAQTAEDGAGESTGSPTGV